MEAHRKDRSSSRVIEGSGGAQGLDRGAYTLNRTPDPKPLKPQRDMGDMGDMGVTCRDMGDMGVTCLAFLLMLSSLDVLSQHSHCPAPGQHRTPHTAHRCTRGQYRTPHTA
eukprot:1293107-Rhodomonas_salina.1